MSDLGDGSEEVRGMIVVAAALAVLFVQLGRVVAFGGFFSDSLFMDSDSYSWLLRAEALAGERGWFDHHEPRINPPDGHEQHWTRPVDALLVAGGWMLGLVVGFRDGLALWAKTVSPVLMVGAVWGMYRLARLLLARREALLATAVFAVQPMTLLTFAFGRPDHHALLRLGQVIFLYCFLHFLLRPQGRARWAFFAGLAGALTIWANVEALAFVLMGLALLGLVWLRGRAELVGANLWCSLGLLAGIAGAVLIERGPRFFSDYPIDTMGFSYVVVFGLTLVFWAGIWAWTRLAGEPGGLWGRLGVSAILAGAVVGALAWWTPQFFAGPFAGVDELYRQTRLEHISEQLPTLRPGVHSLLELMGRGLTYFGIVLVTLVVAAKKVGDAAVDEEIRWAWGLVGSMALIYAVLALDTVRWSAYLPAVAALGMGAVGGWLLDEVKRRGEGAMSGIGRPLVIGAVLLGFTVVGLGLEGLGAELRKSGVDDEVPAATHAAQATALHRTQFCDLRPAVAALEGLDEVSDHALVAINPDRGTELLYRSDHRILAFANHRPQPGFTLFVEVMGSTDRAEGHRRLKKRGVEAVLVCDEGIWPTLRRDGEALVERLGVGRDGGGFVLEVEADQAGGWWIYTLK